jgi:hypothetical protein
LSIGNSRWPPLQDIVYIGLYGKTSELTNPPTVVLTQWAFKENVIEGDGPKNQTQSKMDLYETTVNAVLVN